MAIDAAGEHLAAFGLYLVGTSKVEAKRGDAAPAHPDVAAALAIAGQRKRVADYEIEGFSW